MNGDAVVMVGYGQRLHERRGARPASPVLSSLLARTRQYSVVPTGKILFAAYGVASVVSWREIRAERGGPRRLDRVVLDLLRRGAPLEQHGSGDGRPTHGPDRGRRHRRVLEARRAREAADSGLPGRVRTAAGATGRRDDLPVVERALVDERRPRRIARLVGVRRLHDRREVGVARDDDPVASAGRRDRRRGVHVSRLPADQRALADDGADAGGDDVGTGLRRPSQRVRRTGAIARRVCEPADSRRGSCGSGYGPAIGVPSSALSVNARTDTMHVSPFTTAFPVGR